MITENIQNLFSFIDFLNSKKEYLLSKQSLIDETNELLEKRSSIRPNENYKSKINYDKIQKQISEKFDVVEAEIIFPLKKKISELNIADVSTPIINLTAQSDLFKLQRNFEEDDLKLIFEARQKYLNFRNETNCDYYLQIFFFDLDRALKEFYEFFKDEDFNEFNKLQTNVVKVESLNEQGLEKAVRKLTGNSNKLHFETFPEFLNYFNTNFNDVEIDERHSEAKRLLEQRRLMLENSTFQSEIDEILDYSENAVKDFKHKLMLSFTNENYKTKYNGGLNPIVAISKLYFEYVKLYNDAVEKNNHLEVVPPKQLTQTDNPAQPIKYTAKEYALTYIFDLWTEGKQIPQNRIEGGLNKKELEKIGIEVFKINGDTFYRAVKELTGYDLNKTKQLQGISQDWQNSIANLSKNWGQTKNYLIDKGLYRE